MELEITISILLFFGILFTALPTVPGMLYMLILTIVYGIIDKFEMFDPWWYVLFGGLVVLAILSDYFSGIIGAKFGGANKKSILTGIIGMIVGFVVFPPFGLFIGLFLTIFVAELIQFMDHEKAFKAATYSAAAMLIGIALNVVFGIAFFVSFLILVF